MATEQTQEERTQLPGANKTGPLRGIRIVDFGWAWAGATAGQVLGDFGAEVIKIESRTRPDPMRQGRPIIGTEPDPEQNPICHNVNRNKFSLGVNLKAPGGPELVRDLVQRSDVVIENMTPGALKRLNLTYQDLRAVRPDLVMVSLPAIWSEGPMSEMKAYAPTITGISGYDSLNGYEGEEPLGFQQALADPNVGLHAAFAVLAALRHRKRTGQGQFIQTSQARAMLPLLGEAVAEQVMTGRTPGPTGNRRLGFAPHGTFPTQGEDKWISIVIRSEDEWERLCKAIERPDLRLDERFADGHARASNADALESEIGRWTSAREAQEAVVVLQEHGVPSAPCLDTAERFHNDHLMSREAYVPVEHPVLGAEFIYGSPWKMSKSEARVWKRVPLLGEDTDAVLRDVLGLAEPEISELRGNGVLE